MGYPWWMFEPFHLSVTAVWSVIIFSLLGVVKPAAAFQQLSQPAVMLFLGATIILGAWSESGLIRRYAYTMLGLKFIGGQSSKVIIMFSFAGAILSSLDRDFNPGAGNRHRKPGPAPAGGKIHGDQEQGQSLPGNSRRRNIYLGADGRAGNRRCAAEKAR